jgi:hypothetical protein
VIVTTKTGITSKKERTVLSNLQTFQYVTSNIVLNVYLLVNNGVFGLMLRIFEIF